MIVLTLSKIPIVCCAKVEQASRVHVHELDPQQTLLMFWRVFALQSRLLLVVFPGKDMVNLRSISKDVQALVRKHKIREIFIAPLERRKVTYRYM